MRGKVLISLLASAIFAGLFYWTYAGHWRSIVEPIWNERELRMALADSELSQRVPVPTNRRAGIPDGFRGKIHPLLHHHAELEVKAYWQAAIVKKSELLTSRSTELDKVRALFMDVSTAVSAAFYSESDFSAFLPPENVNAAGEMWAVDPEKLAVFLKQFHPAVSVHSASVGRRPGPDGAFAMIRGVSPSYLDIAFRAHAEFDLAPTSGEFPALHVWYTPACFMGRIVVNRSTGTVEYFQVGVPTDETMNIHATVWVGKNDNPPHNHDAVHQHLRAERMELVGGSLQGLEGAQWASRIEPSQVSDDLAKVFYKFKEIDFVPFPDALATARARNKPIFAVVALGALDDQSC